MLDSSAGVSPIPAPHPQAPSVEPGKTDERVSGYKGEEGTPDKGWAGLCEGEALCWQIRSEARSASALSLTPTHLPQTPLPPPNTPAPGREGKFVPSGTALGSSRLKSEWPLPSPESATSSPGKKKKYCERGNGGVGSSLKQEVGGHRALRNEM